MAKLTKDQIEYIANLARIEIHSAELSDMSEQISSIVDFVDDLASIDTNDVVPTSQVTGLSDVWREDEVVNCSISQAMLLANAPAIKDGYVMVKKIL